MNILHVSASPRGPEGDSHRLSQHVVRQLQARYCKTALVERMLWRDELPQVDGVYARALSGGVQDLSGPATEGGSLARSDQLIGELEVADVVVIGAPMHNLTVPSTLKAWLDHVVRVHRTVRPTPQGKVGMLPDRPVYVAVSSGGWRTGPRARNPDFFEPYLRAVLAMVGLRSLTLFSMEGTALGPERAVQARREAYAAVEAHFAAPAQVDTQTVRACAATS